MLIVGLFKIFSKSNKEWALTTQQPLSAQNSVWFQIINTRKKGDETDNILSNFVVMITR